MDFECLVVATHQEEVIGFSAVYRASLGELRGVTVVKNAWRKRGIGTALLRKRLAIMPDVVTKVWVGNKASIRICEKNNMELVMTEIVHKRKIVSLKKAKRGKKVGANYSPK